MDILDKRSGRTKSQIALGLVALWCCALKSAELTRVKSGNTRQYQGPPKFIFGDKNKLQSWLKLRPRLFPKILKFHLVRRL